MKSTNISSLQSAAVIALWFGATSLAQTPVNRTADEVMPLVVIESVALADAIRNLARQANINYILDPRVPGSTIGPGRRLKEPYVSRRWEKRTLGSVLSDVLKEQRLMLVENPTTSVARIAPENAGVSPISTNVLHADTNSPLPLLSIENVSLVDAIENLARRADRKVIFDPRFADAKLVRDGGVVSIRWENVTLGQALAALLDNFDLIMVENASKKSVLVTIKAGVNRVAGKEPAESRPRL
jgi:hypothetical protein